MCFKYFIDYKFKRWYDYMTDVHTRAFLGTINAMCSSEDAWSEGQSKSFQVTVLEKQ